MPSFTAISAAHQELQTICLTLLWCAGVGTLVRWTNQVPIAAQDPDWALAVGGWANLLAVALVALDSVFGGVGQWRDIFRAYLLSDKLAGVIVHLVLG
jgi:hypothetical protein